MDDARDRMIRVGYVRRAHGIRGAVIVRVLGDELGQFTDGHRLATDSRRHPELEVVSAAPHKDGLLVVFEQIPDRNQAEELRGTTLFIAAAERRPLDDDEYWPEQLVGLQVVDVDGVRLGLVTDVLSGPQDRLVVTTDQGERQVPFVAAIVTSVDLAAGVIVVDPPAGLL